MSEAARTVYLTLTVPLDAPRLLMLELAEKVLYQVPIRAVAGVSLCSSSYRGVCFFLATCAVGCAT